MFGTNYDELRNIAHELEFQRKLSLRDVAAKAEVSASLLSQIETGKVNPSVMSLYNIATALGVPVSELFPLAEVPTHAATPIEHTKGNGMAHYTPAPQKVMPVAPNSSSATAMRDAVLQNSDVRDAAFGDVASEGGCIITRKANRPTINLMHGVTWARLTCQPEQGIEFLELNYNPGASSGPAMSHHNGREWGLVVTGELLLELGFDMHILRPGDSIVFDSNTPHRLNNRGSEAMKAIWVVFDKNVER